MSSLNIKTSFIYCPMDDSANVSVNSNWVHPPGQPPEISSKNLSGESRFDFRKLPGDREFDKGRDSAYE